MLYIDNWFTFYSFPCTHKRVNRMSTLNHNRIVCDDVIKGSGNVIKVKMLNCSLFNVENSYRCTQFVVCKGKRVWLCRYVHTFHLWPHPTGPSLGFTYIATHTTNIIFVISTMHVKHISFFFILSTKFSSAVVIIVGITQPCVISRKEYFFLLN